MICNASPGRRSAPGFVDAGRSYVYGYTRLLSDLYLVKGLR